METDAVAGPQRAYKLACRLADQMRPLGRTAIARADWALAHTQFWRGQFEQSRALLAAINIQALTPENSAGTRLELLIPAQLSWTYAALGEVEAALAQAQQALNWAQENREEHHLATAWVYLGLLNCMLDQPTDTLAWSRLAHSATCHSAASNSAGFNQTQIQTQASQRHTATLLEYWALSRLGDSADEPRAQAALSGLRSLGRAHEARGFSLYAQAAFQQSPRHAQTQLDAALDLNARCGLHHWEARLLRMKSSSLDAAGQLTEASRFLKLAQEIAQRQNARLFLIEITGLESRSNAGSYMEYTA